MILPDKAALRDANGGAAAQRKPGTECLTKIIGEIFLLPMRQATAPLLPQETIRWSNWRD
jgi:hypothetical protein